MSKNPTAYYNEHDPKAAAWLRELMKDGLITEGEVDERSIEDVVPADLDGFTRCHFFAGIGVWDYALNRAGWPADRKVWTGSCPCQPFSAAGKGEGFADERHLWPAFFHLIYVCRPDTLFGEQVSSADGTSWLDLVFSDMEGIGYAVAPLDIPAAGVGAPHIRQRLYFVADSQHARLDRPKRVAAVTHCDEPGEWVFERDGAACELADADGGNESTERLQRSGQHGQQPQDGGAVQLADAVPAGRTEGWAESGNGQAAGSGGFGELEKPAEFGRRGRGDGDTAGNGGQIQTEGRSTFSELGNADGGRCEQRDQGERNIQEFNERRFTNGFWRDAEWIYCRDGKYRPVEPGTFPLVAGAPARVGRLRGYGNAIVAPVAEEFIRSYLEL